MNIEKIYENRFPETFNAEKNKIWHILCKYFFQKFIPENSILVDVSAGNCEFINNIKAKQKYAFDLNSNSRKCISGNVIFENKSLFDISKSIKEADIIFCSNTLEHLNNKEELIKAFSVFRETLKGKGKVLILQPNIKYTKGKYWDFVDHILPLTDKTIIEAGEINGFKTVYNLKKFLPFTTKSKKPKWSWLIWLYIKLLPISGYFFGEQSFLILEKSDD